MEMCGIFNLIFKLMQLDTINREDINIAFNIFYSFIEPLSYAVGIWTMFIFIFEVERVKLLLILEQGLYQTHMKSMKIKRFIVLASISLQVMIMTSLNWTDIINPSKDNYSIFVQIIVWISVLMKVITDFYIYVLLYRGIKFLQNKFKKYSNTGDK